MTSVGTPLVSVSAYQSLLHEDDYDLKEEALKILLHNVNIHWAEIANDITEMYTRSHAASRSTRTRSSRRGPWQPSCWPSCTST